MSTELNTSELFVGLPPPDPRQIVWTHEIARSQAYPRLGDQLDLLYKDIAAGLFGEQAKTGQFFQTIKTIKDTYAKDEVFRPFENLPPPG